MTELEWLDLASVRFWARVYALRALTNCTLEDAIRAIQLADREHIQTAD